MTSHQSRAIRPLVASVIVIASLTFAAIAISLAPVDSEQNPTPKETSGRPLSHFVGQSIQIVHREPTEDKIEFENGRLEYAGTDWVAFRPMETEFTVWIPTDRVCRIEVVH